MFEAAVHRPVAGRPATLKVLGEVLGTPARRVMVAGVAAAVTLLYTVLLPFDYTQRLTFANWQYLNASAVAWSLALGMMIGLVLGVQVYAVRKAAAAKVRTGAAGIGALLVSLSSSFLCCTPIIPTLLAFMGVSGTGLYLTTGSLQHFFATSQTPLLGASLALLVASGWWGTREIATAKCLNGCCKPPAATTTRGPQHPGAATIIMPTASTPRSAAADKETAR